MQSDSVLIMSNTLLSPARSQINRARPGIDGNGPPILLKFPKSTLPKMLEETARKYPGRRALVYFGMEMSYGQLLDHVNRCAAGLQALGVRKGERVALMMPNCPQYVIAYFGALRAGAMAVGGSVQVTTLPGYLPLQHDAAMLDLYRANAEALVGASNVTPLGHRTGSTDMGDVSHEPSSPVSAITIRPTLPPLTGRFVPSGLQANPNLPRCSLAPHCFPGAIC